LLSVPLAAVGGFASLGIVHFLSTLNPVTPTQNLDVLTMLGFIILIGVVVNNAILIVHQALNNIRDAQMEPQIALRESVRTRVRPIFMSALTSICGMLPLVIMPGAGSELYRGLGAVVVGGLLVSTAFTLILVPAMFSLFVQAKAALSRLYSRAEPVTV
jgi:HAE1 family hydrophobic/amphiphilic exporter-1